MFSDDGPLYADPRIAQDAGFVHMGVAADLVATLEGFERAELDDYGVTSHHRAAHAWAEGRFDHSLFVPVDEEGTTPLLTDEHVRPGATVEQAAAMAPAFAELGAEGQDAVALDRFPRLTEVRHVHHRANSPSLADGAGVVLLASEAACRRLGLVPRAVVRACATHSVDPVIMLTAGQIAVRKAVGAAGLRLGDIALFEFAEAFAALCRKFLRDLDVGPDRFNVNGGTIAMGHAFGATGAILVATLLDELERRNGSYGVVGISGAAGLGVATVFERVAP
jgi:acetyl-CoA C-acetyltransferase